MRLIPAWLLVVACASCAGGSSSTSPSSASSSSSSASSSSSGGAASSALSPSSAGASSASVVASSRAAPSSSRVEQSSSVVVFSSSEMAPASSSLAGESSSLEGPSSGPAPDLCGNGAIDPGEQCEDGNTMGGDGCSGCQGEPGWSCGGLPSVCVTACGDGIRAGLEECDDHNTATDDGCDEGCHQQYLDEIEPNEDGVQALMNGPIRPGFVYRASLELSGEHPDAWLMRITTPTQIRLQISDVADFDSCGTHDPAVFIYSYAGAWVASEADNGPGACVDLNAINGWTHQVAPGDYVFHVHSQRSSEVIPQYFLKLSYLSLCGDGVKQQYEQCDGTPDCDASCRFIPVCPSGRIEDHEQCDDGNMMDGDGCSAACQIEPTWRCLVPTFCFPMEDRCNNAVDDDGDGRTDGADADCLPFGDGVECAAGQTRVVLGAKDVPRPLPDVATTESTIHVPAGYGVVRRAALKVDVLNRDPEQLDMFLRAPSGQSVELSTDNGGIEGHGYNGTTFDDACARPVTTGLDPFTGCFSPEGSLAALNGTGAEGAWSLVITDDTTIKTGTVTTWSLILCTE